MKRGEFVLPSGVQPFDLSLEKHVLELLVAFFFDFTRIVDSYQQFDLSLEHHVLLFYVRRLSIMCASVRIRGNDTMYGRWPRARPLLCKRALSATRPAVGNSPICCRPRFRGHDEITIIGRAWWRSGWRRIAAVPIQPNQLVGGLAPLICLVMQPRRVCVVMSQRHAQTLDLIG